MGTKGGGRGRGYSLLKRVHIGVWPWEIVAARWLFGYKKSYNGDRSLSCIRVVGFLIFEIPALDLI